MEQPGEGHGHGVRLVPLIRKLFAAVGFVTVCIFAYGGLYLNWEARISLVGISIGQAVIWFPWLLPFKEDPPPPNPLKGA